MVRTIFMGTPEFAVPILVRLAEHYEVAAVYTRTDKPAGRGKTMAESPVKILARERRLTIEQPRTLRDTETQSKLRDYRPDLIVVAAYGLILPQAVLDIPPHGSLNVHASLLPRWRGASPIAFAILAGDTETGITLMKMDAGLDTGPILSSRVVPITTEDTAGTLSDKLSQAGAGLLIETLPEWLEAKIKPTPQNDTEATFTRLVKKEDGHIDWNKPADEIARTVRAYSPWPGAWTLWRSSSEDGGHILKISRAVAAGTGVPAPPGAVVQVGDQIGVSTGVGMLLLEEVQLAGKRAMPVKEFVRGHRGFIGSRLG